MLGRTNVGITPLMSTPMTTSFVSTPQFQTMPATASYTQEAYPTTSYGAKVVDQGLTIPQTTTYTTQDPLSSFAPQITTPDQALTSFVPDATNIVTAPAQEIQSVVPSVQASTTTSVVPNVIYSQQATQPATNPPVAPIMDEDFQRGRPIYDEFNEDRYRNFKFGSQ